MKHFKNTQEVGEWRLCVGCGACAYACQDGNITLVDVLQDGIRPICDNTRCQECGDCVKVCPGVELYSPPVIDSQKVISALAKNWGSVLEVWEGYATDPEIRRKGSSGGLATALALYCIEKGKMAGVLHIGPDEKEAYRNRTFFSTSRSALLRLTGSRYSPASPCNNLKIIEGADNPCVFVGKPCDCAGLRKAQQLRPGLAGKTGVAISIFCAGTPSTKGTLDLLEGLGVTPDQVQEMRYRGNGWPGRASVRTREEKAPVLSLSYKESWGFLQKYRPYRCYLCPDGTGESADISCGDPWYRKIGEDEAGFSLVLVRTERGRSILRGAIENGYVLLEPAEPAVLQLSQKGMPMKRGAIWGRLLVMKALGIPTPQLIGFSLLANWLDLPIEEKARSLYGTFKRILQRKYHRPFKYS